MPNGLNTSSYNEEAFDTFNKKALEPCPNCRRTFLPESLAKHQKACKGTASSALVGSPRTDPQGPRTKLAATGQAALGFGTTSSSQAPLGSPAQAEASKAHSPYAGDTKSNLPKPALTPVQRKGLDYMQKRGNAKLPGLKQGATPPGSVDQAAPGSKKAFLSTAEL